MKAERAVSIVLVLVAAGVVALSGSKWFPPKEAPSSAAAAECGPECQCLPPCPCEVGGECLPENQPTASTANPPFPCTACGAVLDINGNPVPGLIRVSGKLQKCPVCGGDGVIDPDPRDPESQPGFNPAALRNIEPPPALRVPNPKAEFVTVQQPYTVRAGLRGRRSYTAYRTRTMTRAEYEAQKAGPTQSYSGGGACRSCR